MTHPDHEKNRKTWDKMVDLHVNHPGYKTQQVIEGGSSLKRIELEALGDVTGKSLLHLQCQFGLDTLSWARQGALVTGVDISQRSIEVARELTVKAGLEAEFVQSDVLELIGKIDRKFDIVFQSYGTHMWLSDMNKLAEVVAHYLKPGGTYLLVDEHPISWLFLYADENFDYFATQPYRTVNPRDYCEMDTHIEGEHVEWLHNLSKMFNAFIGAGLEIERFEEYPFGYYKAEDDWYSEDGGDFWFPPGGKTKFPLLMKIQARKK